MDTQTIHALTGVLAVLLGGLVVIIPIAGLTVRFAFRPVIQSWLELKERQLTNPSSDLLQQRVSLLEAELQQVQHQLRAVTEADEFRRLMEESGSAAPRPRAPTR
jgi:hypothetical protein